VSLLDETRSTEVFRNMLAALPPLADPLIAVAHNRLIVFPRWRQSARPTNERFLTSAPLTIRNGGSIDSASLHGRCRILPTRHPIPPKCASIEPPFRMVSGVKLRNRAALSIGRVSYIGLRISLCYICLRWKTVSLVQASMQHLMHHILRLVFNNLKLPYKTIA